MQIDCATSVDQTPINVISVIMNFIVEVNANVIAIKR